MKKITLFDVILTVVLLFLAFITLYPFWYVVVKSLLPMETALADKFALWPGEISLDAYSYVFSSKELLGGFAISVLVTVSVIVYQLTVTSLAAFALSKKDLPYRKIIFGFVVVTMFFGGGLIPYYLQIKRLGLIDNMLVLILPHGITAYNLIIMKSFFENIPKELSEAAEIDGAGYVRIFFRICLPLSGAVLATIGLFVGVGAWNNWYPAMLYLNDRTKWPIAMFLREILINSATEISGADSAIFADKFMLSESIKMAVIVVSMIPIVMIYPFVQKFFVKGVMLGAVKS